MPPKKLPAYQSVSAEFCWDISTPLDLSAVIPADVDAVVLSDSTSTVTTLPTIQKLPKSVRRIRADNSCGGIRHVPDRFLFGSPGLVKVELDALSKDVNVGLGFLGDCKRLTNVTLPLKIVSIGDGFMSGCRSLPHVDLQPLSGIEAIPDLFLSGCRSLGEVDLSPLSQVLEIGNNFLCYCGITAIDLSKLVSIGSIGDGFLALCTKLLLVDAGPLACAPAFGDRFMHGCSSLKEIEFAAATDVALIGRDFLSRTALNKIDLSSFVHVGNIGAGFLEDCESLHEVKLPPRLETVGTKFMSGCRSLPHVDLQPLSGIEAIPDLFLSGCRSLGEVDLSPLSQVLEIGNNFLSQYEGTVNLSPLQRLLKVGDLFANQIRWKATIVVLPTQELLKNSMKRNNAQTTVVGWSWRSHYQFPVCIRSAACMLHSRFSYRHPASHEELLLPAEIAQEICSYLSTTFEILTG